MNKIILEKYKTPVLKNEKKLKKNRFLSIQNIDNNLSFRNDEELDTMNLNLYEDYARVQFKDILTKENLQKKINSYMLLEKVLIIRIVPNFIKDFAVSFKMSK